MNNKGLIDIETKLSSLLIIIVFIAVLSVTFVCYKNIKSEEPNQKNIISIYNNIVNAIRLDARRAVKAITEKDAFTLFDKNSVTICRYELKDGNLVRYDKDNKLSIMMEKIESLSFTTQENLPNLLTVRIFSADKNEIPFFTSFALRGFDNRNDNK